ncbi:hypothetical protein AAFF_G00175760 [Aldrovandia affinis]|uniref:Uncharacterized protein n=1 Tax=Aldrovandia affinis TaxID=143900 RepID=A0AAD7RNU1_9TELE|nr:hypothetical protein AAFF_G00175760 [Aldrovandia affinis]
MHRMTADGSSFNTGEAWSIDKTPSGFQVGDCRVAAWLKVVRWVRDSAWRHIGACLLVIRAPPPCSPPPAQLFTPERGRQDTLTNPLPPSL